MLFSVGDDQTDSCGGRLVFTGHCREVRENLFNTVYKYFHDLDMGMRPISVFFPYLPIEAHRKRDAARAELARIFSKVRSFALICCATDDGTRDCADGHMHMLRRSSGYSAP